MGSSSLLFGVCARASRYIALAQDHGELGDSLEMRLAAFSEAVRRELAQRMLHAWGSSSMPVRSFVYMVFSMNARFLMSTIPNIAAQLSSQSTAGEDLETILANLLGWASCMPCMLLYLWFCIKNWSRGRHPTFPILADVASMLFAVAAAIVIWGAVVFSLHLPSPYPLLGALPFLFFMALGFYLLRTTTLGSDGARDAPDESVKAAAGAAGGDSEEASTFSI